MAGKQERLLKPAGVEQESSELLQGVGSRARASDLMPPGRSTIDLTWNRLPY